MGTTPRTKPPPEALASPHERPEPPWVLALALAGLALVVIGFPFFMACSWRSRSDAVDDELPPAARGLEFPGPRAEEENASGSSTIRPPEAPHEAPHENPHGDLHENPEEPDPRPGGR